MSARIIAITGGSSGIGLAMAKAFLEQGDKVAIMGRSIERLQSIQALSLEHCLIFCGDVGRTADITAFYNTLQSRWSCVDVVIANAGIAQAQAIEEVDDVSFTRSVDINFKGVFFTVQKVLPLLNKNASIILISSIQAQKGAGIWSIYSATKAAVRSLTRSFAQELGPQGIRVNTISPGVTNTPILDSFGFEASKLTEILEGVKANTPLGRLGRPEEIARAALFLSSDSASFITGSDLQVDGGLAQI